MCSCIYETKLTAVIVKIEKLQKLSERIEPNDFSQPEK